MNKSLKNIAFGLVLIGVGAMACVPSSTTQKSSKVVDQSHSDDAAKYRPKVAQAAKPEVIEEVIQNEAITSEFSIDGQMQAIVDSMYVRNDSIRLWDGFSILVYSGNNELEASRVRNRLFDLVPDQEAKFSYKLPTYFVKIGQYFQQVEALPLLKEIQQTYPSAAIVPEKFPIVKADDASEN